MNYFKTYITVASLMLGGLCSTVQAQTEKDDEVVITTSNGETEEIEVPEMMMQDIDSLLAQYHAKTYLTTDPDCHYSDDVPTYPAEVYQERLQRIPSTFDMQYNEAVQQFIDRWVKRRKTVSMMLGASNFYMPIFEQALDAYDIPLELKYLPVIESALNPNAVSKAGATGLWQFMLATGKTYGLKVNTLVDERRDPEKESQAAAQYLSKLYHIFGDWNLVLAAYNAGPAVVNKAIHRAGGEKDYWKISKYLPKETRGYVPGFIAATYIMNYYCEHNICPMVTALPAKTDTVMVTKDVKFEKVARVLGLDAEMLRAINPMYRHDVICGNSGATPLRLPIDCVHKFIDNEDAIYGKNDSYESNVQESVKDNNVEEQKAPEVQKPETKSPVVEKRSKRRQQNQGYTYIETNNDKQKAVEEEVKTQNPKQEVKTPVQTYKSKKSDDDESKSNKYSRYSKKSKSDKDDDDKSSKYGKKSKKDKDDDKSSKYDKKSKSKKDKDDNKSSKKDKKSKKDDSKSSKKAAKATGGKEIDIKNGESLSVIAEKNHTTVDKLKKLNGLKSDKIRAGDKLKVK